MEKATTPWEGNEVILSSDSDDSSPSSDSDTEIKDVSLEIRATNSNNVVVKSAKEHTFEEIVARRAKMYQDYMKCIPIPKQHESVIPFDTWGGLANSMKQLYKQPLHYLTNVLLKQWDRARMYTDNEDVPLEDIFHPRKAEDTIWQIEEVHRLNTSHYHLTKLWLADPMHHAHVDSIMAKPSV